MRLAAYVIPIRTRVVLVVLRRVLWLLAFAQLPPLLVALACAEWRVAAAFGVVGVAASALAGRRASTPPDLRRAEALVVTALAYLLFALAGALPFATWAPFGDGLFEAMSGYTTTGLSVIDVETAPRSLLFFRSYSQWLGGAGIVVVSLAVLLDRGRTSFQLYAAEFRGEKVVGNVIVTARTVMKVYVVLTVLATVLLVLAGMPWFDALLHAFSSLSTGGFSPDASSVGGYGTPLVAVVVGLFMLAGATSFPLFHRALREGPRRLLHDGQLRVLLALGLLSFGGALVAGGFDLTAAGRAAFHAVSAVTTTGFALTPVTSWSDGDRALILGLMIVGGSVGSTAGGLKLVRVILAGRYLRLAVARVLLPDDAQVPLKYDGQQVAEPEVRAILAYVVLYLLVLGVSTLLLVAGGHASADALFECASALGTVGLSAGLTGSELVWWSKGVLFFDMWAGRLEILPILILLYPHTWPFRKRTT